MIARVWRGVVRSQDADPYLEYLEKTGFAGYRATPGNEGLFALRRIEGDRCEFLLLTLWDSMDAIKGFAGAFPERAVFYPEDDRYLIDRDLTASHWEVVAAP